MFPYQTVDAGVFYAITALVYFRALGCVGQNFLKGRWLTLGFGSLGELTRDAREHSGKVGMA